MAVAETEESEVSNLERLCQKSPENSLCQEDSGFIPLQQREGDELLCLLTPDNKDREEKCKVLVRNRELIVYIEKGEVLTYINAKNTEEIKISLDDIFVFNSPWWLGNLNTEIIGIKDARDALGIFSSIQIGFISKFSSSDSVASKFITISPLLKDNFLTNKNFSNKNIAKVLEQIESWRSYLADRTFIKNKLVNKIISDNNKANNYSSVKQLLETKQCPYCNLSNANLESADLEYANLEGANLSNTNIQKAKLKNAYLLGANLNKANLSGANLEGSILTFASLVNTNLVESNLKTANLENANLENAELREAQLNSNKFQITYLQEANLNGANLSNVDLKCVNLHSASLKNANLAKANLSTCKTGSVKGLFSFSQLILNRVSVYNTNFITFTVLDTVLNIISISSDPSSQSRSQSRLQSTWSSEADFSNNSNLSNANLNGANLTETNFKGANLFNVNLTNTILNSANLKDTNLRNANFINAKLKNIDIKDLDLCNAILPDISISEQGCYKNIDDKKDKEE